MRLTWLAFTPYRCHGCKEDAPSWPIGFANRHKSRRRAAAPAAMSPSAMCAAASGPTLEQVRLISSRAAPLARLAPRAAPAAASSCSDETLSLITPEHEAGESGERLAPPKAPKIRRRPSAPPKDADPSCRARSVVLWQSDSARACAASQPPSCAPVRFSVPSARFAPTA